LRGKALRSYREDLDIIADILSVAIKGGAKKTQIMYQANLSYMLLKKYLNDVLEASLLRFDNDSGCYFLTPKGKRFLIVYREYTRRNRHVERQINNLQDKRRRLKQLCLGGGEDEDT
jgi:predicted transcriptional regulator